MMTWQTPERSIRRRILRNSICRVGDSADSGSLVRYLQTFDQTVAVMQTRESLIRVASECVQDLAVDGVVYAEIRFAPELHTEQGLRLGEVVRAVLDGVTAGTAAAQAAGEIGGNGRPANSKNVGSRSIVIAVASCLLPAAIRFGHHAMHGTR